MQMIVYNTMFAFTTFLSPPAQDTSVVSPIVTVLVLALLPFLYASSSPSLLHNNCQLFFLAMCLPFVKTVIIMVVSHVTSVASHPLVSFPNLLY